MLGKIGAVLTTKPTANFTFYEEFLCEYYVAFSVKVTIFFQTFRQIQCGCASLIKAAKYTAIRNYGDFKTKSVESQKIGLLSRF